MSFLPEGAVGGLPISSPKGGPVVTKKTALLMRLKAAQGAPKSFVQELRSQATPPVPKVFSNLREEPPRLVPEGEPQRTDLFPQFPNCTPARFKPGGSSGTQKAPVRIGIVFAGERASLPAQPVNILAGMFAYLEDVAPGSAIIGFLDGPIGLLQHTCREILSKEVRSDLNVCGGWQLLGYGTCSDGGFTVQDRAQEATTAMEVCTAEQLDALVVVAGPKDMSWAATLAVCFAEAKHPTSIIGVPHSKNLNLYVPEYMPITLGFDSARCMMQEVAGNFFVDSLSSRKYWHFIRCGEDALTMETALQTRCTFSVLTVDRGPKGDSGSPTHQETLEERMSLKGGVTRLREVIERRKTIGRLSGVVLLSRHLIETLPEMERLRRELAQIVGPELLKGRPPSVPEVERQIVDEDALALFKRLPRVIQLSLINKRDADGLPLLPNDLDPERILGRFVQQELRASKVKVSIAPRFHAMDLTSNAPLPSTFDCAFGYTLGLTAAALACERLTFHVACCANMHKSVAEWEPCSIPFSYLYPKPEAGAAPQGSELEIQKIGWMLRRTLVKVYRHFREQWVECNVFKSPGPIQFNSGGDVGPMSSRPFTLLAEYLSVEELKRMIQPVVDLPPPVQVSLDSKVYRDIRVTANLSPLEQERLQYEPALPFYLRCPVRAQDEDITPQATDASEELAKSFPHTYPTSSSFRLIPLEEVPVTPHACDPPESMQVQTPPSPRRMQVGIVFSSSQAPGFHTVVAGLYDYLSSMEPPALIMGFLCGYEGLLNNHCIEITQEVVDQYRNLGGHDMLCQFGDHAPLVFKDHLKAVTATIAKRKLDGLVLVGNLFAQIDSAFIAEACAAEKLPTRIIGVPVSLDCDFPFVQQTIGHDTVCRTLTSLIGNLGNMAQSAGNLWIFIRTAGDAWSHVVVQTALETHPNMALLSGSQLLGQCLSRIVKILCDLIVDRHKKGHDYGIVLLPQGLVTDITDVRLLFSEIMEVMQIGQYEPSWDAIPNIAAKLKPSTAALFDVIPRDVQYEICFGGRERHTNQIDVSQVSCERLLLRFVEIELQRRRELGLVTEDFFHGMAYPMVYQARSALPTNFDCDLAYTLGWGAGMLITQGKSGQLVHAQGLEKPVDQWRVQGIPFTSLIDVEFDEESQEDKILPAHLHLLKQRGVVRPFLNRLPPPADRFTLYHGPVQYTGPADSFPGTRTTWFMENQPKQDPGPMLQDIAKLCAELQSTMALAKAESTLYTVNSLLSNAVSVLGSYKYLDDSRRTISQSLADIPIDQMSQVWRIKGGEASTKQKTRPGRPKSPCLSPSRAMLV